MKKPAPIDTAAIERATRFDATIFLGTGRFRTESFDTLSEARAAAIRFAAEVRNGRKGMVYAISAGRSAFVPDAYQPKEGAIDMTTQTTPLAKIMTSTEIAKLTAMITGGGFKRANSREAAIKRFLNAAAGRGIATDRILGAGSFEQAKSVLAHSLKTTPAKATDTPPVDDEGRPGWIDDDGMLRVIDPEPAKIGGKAKAVAAVKGEPAEKAASKPAKAPRAPAADQRPAGKRAAVLEAAQSGELPAVPDFSANTHKPHRKKLADVVALVEKGDIEALKAFHINPVSSSPKAIAKYRDLAVIALEARVAFDKADQKHAAQVAG